jgi:hypothetical protein
VIRSPPEQTGRPAVEFQTADGVVRFAPVPDFTGHFPRLFFSPPALDFSNFVRQVAASSILLIK